MQDKSLNIGQGVGVSFRARMLIQLETEITEIDEDDNIDKVQINICEPIDEVNTTI